MKKLKKKTFQKLKKNFVTSRTDSHSRLVIFDLRALEKCRIGTDMPSTKVKLKEDIGNKTFNQNSKKQLSNNFIKTLPNEQSQL